MQGKMATTLWRYTTPQKCLKFSPSFIQCRYLRGTNLDEEKWPGKFHTVRSALEDFPGYITPHPERRVGRYSISEPGYTRITPFMRKGNHPGELPTFQDLMKRLNGQDPDLTKPIDIGLPSPKEHKSSKVKASEFSRQQRTNEELEKAARLRTLKVALDEVHADWEVTDWPQHMHRISEHYGIYRDLFNGAFFVPRVPLRISYDYNDDLVTPVHRGNHIKPSEATRMPSVHFEAEPGTLWSLVLTNPDGHLLDNTSEYLHWFVGNIPGGSIGEGDVICDYLQPFPPKGTGFHRFIFVLYKQEKRMDYSKLQRKAPCFSLKERTFRTFDFYKENQDLITPAGLAFFQSDYDPSLQQFFHEVLRMKEPIFEYEHLPAYIRQQAIIPHKQPFNLYLEKYRDPKDIGKEILLKRFKTVHPFKGEPLRPKYPLAQPYPKDTPSWLHTEMMKERLRIGKYRGLDVEIFKPERPARYQFKDYSNLDKEFD